MTAVRLSLFALLTALCACDTEAEIAGLQADLDGMAKRPGAFCGGFAGIACPDGQTCVDDPSDDCDPDAGGADCGGVCVRGPNGGNNGNGNGGNSTCRSTDTKVYVGTSLEECSTIRFTCEPGWEYFADDCGCGCTFVGTPCGSNVCGAGQECCNASCGICVEAGGFCTQQFCEPA